LSLAVSNNEPVIVGIKYNPGSLPSGYNEDDLFMGWVVNDKWVTIPNSTVDALNYVVRGTFNHFTEISIVAPPKLQISNDFFGPWGNIIEVPMPVPGAGVYLLGSGLTPAIGD
jgi:hypothetical protein